MRPRTSKTSLWVLAVAPLMAGLIPEARGVILASDGMESYIQGFPLSDFFQPMGGTGFFDQWSPPGGDLTATVVPGTMLAADVSGSVNAVEVRGGQNFPIGARLFSDLIPDSVYAGVLIRLNEGVWDGNNTFSFYLSDSSSPTTNALTFGIRNSNGANDPSNLNTFGGGHFMLRSGTGSPPNTDAVIPQAVETGTDYYLVARYSKSGNGFFDDYDTIDLWLNPMGATPTVPDATMTLAEDTGVFSISYVFGRAAAMQATGTVDAVWFDQLTVGSEWGDVVVPEPGSGMLVLVASLGLVLRRRRQK